MDEFDNAIKAYLASANRPVDEAEQGIHYPHMEPFQSPDLQQKSFHIVPDIEKDMLDDADLGNTEPEVHRVRRHKDGTLVVNRVGNPTEEKNFVEKM
ncbi:hypothetical protein ASPZODRAFT_17124 [Penicilliopsis zonata CBS 506.65]|uniref:Uncharacterized protein n=1 Tax=Penicilliopsis zonata CBS 506.65 TaxID=1073090 RepID=A0A1L9SEU0_9EURO|nr:hypothetical protein ASPZODRAFT_17124 [Penicilliopsis zonata CBS 506.65]OJJ45672.1 hypothetical protein ASPZODRAFT_17124 [Penicilliopsis zonata CBS 506.65]